MAMKGKNKMASRILMCGNEAVAEAAIAAGCRFYAGYPITPQNELIAYMAKRMPEVGGVFIQAESELAAVSMIFGAAVTGERVMTSSSSPGISLKQEGLSYMAACELPSVIINVSRGGPGLGNIAPAQSDYFQAVKGGGHGDYKLIVLAPGSVPELFDLTIEAFDLADKYRMPVMILGDGMLGQMMEPLWLKKPKIKRYERDWILGNCCGREPRIIRSLYLKDGALEEHNKNLQKKYTVVKKEVLNYEEIYPANAYLSNTCAEERDKSGGNSSSCDLLLVAFGSMGRIAKAAMNEASEEGLKVGLIRPITLWPFPEKVIYEAAGRVKSILTIEMNYGQMVEDVRLAAGGRCKVDFYGRSGGGMPSKEEIVAKIRETLK